MSFETNFDKYLSSNNYQFKNRCASSTQQDFVVGINQRKFEIDVKEKKQSYKNHWTPNIPLEYLFIIDDISARRSFLSSPFSAVVVFDDTTSKYHIFTALTLFMMPKERVNRMVSGVGLRGKWLVDFRNSYTCGSLNEVFVHLKEYVGACEKRTILQDSECYMKFEGEALELRGTQRTTSQRSHDFTCK